MKTNIIKKILSATLALTMVFGTGAISLGNTLNSFSINASAVDTSTVVQDGISYEYYIGEIGLVISSATGNFPKSYSVPEKLNGINVKSIDWYCFKGNTQIEEVTIPEGIRYLGIGAFTNCTNLKTVYFNAGQCSTYASGWAGGYGFFDGTPLNKIVFGTEVCEIPIYLCIDAANLEIVEFNGEVTNIGKAAFCSCSSLKGIDAKYLKNLQTIGESAFEASGYESFIAPSTLKEIGDWAFWNTPLKELDLGKIEVIGSQAFSECKKLESVTIPNSVKKLGRRSFYNCTGLKKVWFNANETKNNNLVQWSAAEVNYSNVFGNTGVNEVVFGENVTRIPKKAFDIYDAVSSLETIRFNAKITEIGESAFDNCNYVKDIYYPGTQAEWEKVQIGRYNDIIKEATIHYAPSVSVSGVTITPETASLKIGETKQLVAEVAPYNATNKDIVWTSSNSSIATVSSTGLVTAKSTGTATITATTADGGYIDTCVVTVTSTVIPVTNVSLNFNNSSLDVGDRMRLVATVTPDNATNQNVTWTSSNTAVATVDSNGIVNAISAGTATITATTADGGRTATCSVKVSAKQTTKHIEKNGVSVDYNAGSFGKNDGNVSLKVENITNSSEANKGEFRIKNQKLLALYKISPVDAQGNVIQPNGKVTVRIKAPSEFKNGDKVTVYHWPSGKSVEKLNGVVESGMIKVETSSFSEFGVYRQMTTIERILDSFVSFFRNLFSIFSK